MHPWQALRADTKAWWAYALDRKNGQVALARAAEHRSVRDDVERIRTARRNGGFVVVGYTGNITLHVGNGVTCSGIHSVGMEGYRAFLPVIRYDLVPYSVAVDAVMHGPIITPDSEKADRWKAWGTSAFSYRTFSDRAPELVEMGIPVEYPKY